jgi:chitodextrinase
MARKHARATASMVVAFGLLFGGTIGAATASAGRDRSAPTAPTNLRVTATTPYSISLTWTASKDSSGIASYTICCANVSSMTVSGSTTSVRYTAGVQSSRSYTLFVVARDNAGNASKNSNTVTVSTPPDVTPPTKPVVTVTDVGPTSVSLAWSAVDEGPLWFSVARDGMAIINGTRDTTGIAYLLEPSTTYTLQVAARDFAGHVAAGDPFAVTTEARDGTDTSAPTAPANLRTNGMQFGDGETWLFWDQSSDDVTEQGLIEYRVFLNGVFDHSTVGRGSTVLYGTPFSENTYSVVAVDESANASPPATIVVDNR